MDVFETLAITDHTIEVRHPAVGHRFMFAVIELPQGGRALSDTARIRLDDTGEVDANELLRDAHDFAEREMLEAGKIGR